MNTKAAETRYDRDEAKSKLRDWLTPGDTIHTVLRHVAPSGMTRHIDLYKLQSDEKRGIWKMYLSYWAAKALDNKVNVGRHDGIKIGGAGMDMGFALVYDLGRVLYPDGYPCHGENCHSNDHTNSQPRTKQYTSEDCPGSPCGSECDHVGTPDTIHSDGGYAFSQEWI